MEKELELLKKLYRKSFTESELVDIYYQNLDKYRVILSLIQQPGFPEKLSLNIISSLNPMDLIKVSKNKRASPGIRKRAEIEFVNKYQKFPKGEKQAYLKIAPNSLLLHFVEENDKNLIDTIIKNIYCTEDLILKFINRRSPRFEFYQALDSTEWYKRPQVAFAISRDLEAPIRIMVAIIPYLNLKQLEELYKEENTHQIVKNSIINYLQNR